MKQIQPHPVLHIDLQRFQEERGDTIHLAEMFKSKMQIIDQFTRTDAECSCSSFFLHFSDAVDTYPGVRTAVCSHELARNLQFHSASSV